MKAIATIVNIKTGSEKSVETQAACVLNVLLIVGDEQFMEVIVFCVAS